MSLDMQFVASLCIFLLGLYWGVRDLWIDGNRKKAIAIAILGLLLLPVVTIPLWLEYIFAGPP